MKFRVSMAVVRNEGWPSGGVDTFPEPPMPHSNVGGSVSNVRDKCWAATGYICTPRELHVPPVGETVRAYTATASG